MTIRELYDSQEPTVLEAQKLVPLEWAQRIRDGYEKGLKSLPLLERTKELVETKLGKTLSGEEFMLIITIVSSTGDPEFIQKCVEEEMKDESNDIYGVSERVWYQIIRKLCEDMNG